MDRSKCKLDRKAGDRVLIEGKMVTHHTHQGATALESVLSRDRAVVMCGLIGVSLLAWAYTAYLATSPAHTVVGGSIALPHMEVWSFGDLLFLFVMWTVMMVAMMVPSASQMILTFAKINRKQQAGREPFSPTAAFLLGYVLVWTSFSALGALAQWGLHDAALVSAAGVSTNAIFGGLVLVVAGLFQWSRLKYACLSHCRSPLAFFMTSWRPGKSGALVMGLEHGAFCVGCCWALMALMFVAGVMNLLWLAVIAGFVLVEKLAPSGDKIGRLAGVVFVAWGLYLLRLGLIK